MKIIIRIKRKPQNSDKLTSKTIITTEFTKMQKKRISTGISGKFGIFAKTIIRINRKPQYLKSAFSKTFMQTELTKMQKKNFQPKFLGKFAFSRLSVKIIIRINRKPQYSKSAIQPHYYNRIYKNAEIKFLPEFPGLFGIFAKTIIRIKWKPQYSKSATSNTLITTEFTKLQKKNFWRNFPVYSVFSRKP